MSKVTKKYIIINFIITLTYYYVSRHYVRYIVLDHPAIIKTYFSVRQSLIWQIFDFLNNLTAAQLISMAYLYSFFIINSYIRRKIYCHIFFRGYNNFYLIFL